MICIMSLIQEVISKNISKEKPKISVKRNLNKSETQLQLFWGIFVQNLLYLYDRITLDVAQMKLRRLLTSVSQLLGQSLLFIRCNLAWVPFYIENMTTVILSLTANWDEEFSISTLLDYPINSQSICETLSFILKLIGWSTSWREWK